jgi:hypothetical protein
MSPRGAITCMTNEKAVQRRYTYHFSLPDSHLSPSNALVVSVDKLGEKRERNSLRVPAANLDWHSSSGVLPTASTCLSVCLFFELELHDQKSSMIIHGWRALTLKKGPWRVRKNTGYVPPSVNSLHRSPRSTRSPCTQPHSASRCRQSRVGGVSETLA